MILYEEVCGLLCKTRQNNTGLGSAKQLLMEVWDDFEQTTVDKAIDQWRK